MIIPFEKTEPLFLLSKPRHDPRIGIHAGLSVRRTGLSVVQNTLVSRYTDSLQLYKSG